MGNSPKTKVEEIINIVKIVSIFILFFLGKGLLRMHTLKLKQLN